MNSRLKVLALISIIGCTTIGVAALVTFDNEPHSITGKIVIVEHIDNSLWPSTKITFEDATSIAFTGHLLFTEGDTVTIKYHKSGLLWELLGYGSINSVDVITKI